MSDFARLLGEVSPALERIIARRALDRLLSAAGPHPPCSRTEEAVLEAIGDRLRETGSDPRRLRAELEAELPALPVCLGACLAVASPEFGTCLRPLAETARGMILDRLAGIAA